MLFIDTNYFYLSLIHTKLSEYDTNYYDKIKCLYLQLTSLYIFYRSCCEKVTLPNKIMTNFPYMTIFHSLLTKKHIVMNYDWGLLWDQNC